MSNVEHNEGCAGGCNHAFWCVVNVYRAIHQEVHENSVDAEQVHHEVGQYPYLYGASKSLHQVTGAA